ncbi:MAG: membrane protein insertase YidC, partial [Candidatus Methanoperedens sp.]
MEKRVLIAVLLSIAVMYGYTIIFPQQKSIPLKEQVPVSDTKAPSPVSSVPVSESADMALTAPSTKLVAKDIFVENDVFTAVIAPQNGAIKKLVLKKYKDHAGAKGTEIVLVRDDSKSPLTLTSSYPGFSA